MAAATHRQRRAGQKRFLQAGASEPRDLHTRGRCRIGVGALVRSVNELTVRYGSGRGSFLVVIVATAQNPGSTTAPVSAALASVASLAESEAVTVMRDPRFETDVWSTLETRGWPCALTRTVRRGLAALVVQIANEAP
jgi:hypothetical protein